MTKQEQIDEMAKYICNACEMGHGFDGCSYGGREHYKRCSITQKTAKALYDAGYRKIRETDDTLEEQIKHLNTIVERLDELLGKGIDEYIKGIDGVEGIKDMWERSAVREFAEKLKMKYSLYDDRHILYRIIDELLKEYE